MSVVVPIVISLLILICAGVAMCLRNLIHSVLLLIGTWFGIAVFFLWADAEFVAFSQVLVYVGAVSMIVLFAVLLTRRSRADLVISADSSKRAGYALLAGAAVAATLGRAILTTPVRVATHEAPSLSVRRIGELLMGPHAAALLIVGVLLTVALLGAVVLAATDRRRQP